MAKYTNADIKRLADAMRRSKEAGTTFSLLTGAGCSKTAEIPLARDLVKEIHKKFTREIEHNLEESKRFDYGANMSCLSRAERKILLEPYLTNAKVNWAHIAIATMMNAGFVDRVLTFNFDSVLARACGLLGLYPATYDFAAAPSVETSYIASPAIVHLHGQGYGMVMLNSEEETRQHAVNLRPLLRRVLNDTPLLVVGYSGAADAVFPVIKDEFRGEHRLYWTLYEDSPDSGVEEFIRKGGRTSEALCGADADCFLRDLAIELDCFPPKLFTDPYGHLLDELNPVSEYPLGSDQQQDILHMLRDELLVAQNEKVVTREGHPNIAEMMMRADWEKVIAHANADIPEEREMLAWAIVMQGLSLVDQAKHIEGSEADALLQAAGDKYAHAIVLEPDMHEAFNNWGNLLSEQAQRKSGAEADALMQAAGEKYSRAIELKTDNYDALFNWGCALSDQAERKEGVEADTLWQAACEKYARAIEIKPDMDDALHNWGNALNQRAKYNKVGEAGVLSKMACEKFSRTIELNPEDHQAYNNWGNALGDQAQRVDGAEADALWQSACDKFASALEIKPEDHEVLINWGLVLCEKASRKQGKEADSLLQAACEKFACACEIKLDNYDALYNWGCALCDLARGKEGADAITLTQEAVEKFESVIELKPEMHMAFLNWATALFIQAQHKEGVDADALWHAMFEKFAHATELKPDMHEAFNSWGNALCNKARRKVGAEADALWLAAHEKYNRAIEIKPDFHEGFINWGTAHCEQAQCKDGEEADALLQAAGEKYARAIDIEPSNTEYYDILAASVIDRSYLALDTEIQFQLLDEAHAICRRIIEMNPEHGGYNLACVEGLRGNFVESLACLENVRMNDMLDPEHMIGDRDLSALRETAEFKKWKEQFFPELQLH